MQDDPGVTGPVWLPTAPASLETMLAPTLQRWSYRTFLEHPEQDRFSAQEFVAEVERHGFVLPEPAVTRFFGDFVIGVAVKPATTVGGPL